MFSWLAHLFNMIGGFASVGEDLADTAKSHSSLMKVQKIKEVQEELEDVDMDEINEFMDKLYGRKSKRRK